VDDVAALHDRIAALEKLVGNIAQVLALAVIRADLNTAMKVSLDRAVINGLGDQIAALFPPTVAVTNPDGSPVDWEHFEEGFEEVT
jgi:hypothetical protein